MTTAPRCMNYWTPPPRPVTPAVPALRDWLREQRGVEISADWLWEQLRRDEFRWKQTRDSVRHKAGPVLQQAVQARLEDLRTYGWRRMRASAT
ncbi:hypothetical protein ACFXOD_28760 [Streptomyces sp. NPDC059161]|uniref:hypothetical protein n=1 Tax=Streptomyces sp. NPDC059161 TaxID=3346749 RepID=UPI0036CFFAC3